MLIIHLLIFFKTILLVPIQITNKNRLNASGLIEMLIAMAIFAIAIVAITALNAKNYQQIKTNEITDIANRIMVSNLEFMKAPTTTTNLGSSGQGIQELLESYLTSPSDVVCFRPTAPLDNITNFDVAQVTTPCPTKINRCDTSNTAYKLTNPTNSVLSGLWICNQIIVRMDPVQRGYVINSVIVYQTPKSSPTVPVVNEIIGFRPFTYE
jgi:Tfp pilus assembly protein PilV